MFPTKIMSPTDRHPWIRKIMRPQTWRSTSRTNWMTKASCSLTTTSTNHPPLSTSPSKRESMSKPKSNKMSCLISKLKSYRSSKFLLEKTLSRQEWSWFWKMSRGNSRTTSLLSKWKETPSSWLPREWNRPTSEERKKKREETSNMPSTTSKSS